MAGNVDRHHESKFYEDQPSAVAQGPFLFICGFDLDFRRHLAEQYAERPEKVSVTVRHPCRIQLCKSGQREATPCRQPFLYPTTEGLPVIPSANVRLRRSSLQGRWNENRGTPPTPLELRADLSFATQDFITLGQRSRSPPENAPTYVVLSQILPAVCATYSLELGLIIKGSRTWQALPPIKRTTPSERQKGIKSCVSLALFA